MRTDELPKSERIEDRRGRSSGLPGGRGSLGIGTIVVLGLIGSVALPLGRTLFAEFFAF